MAEQARIRPQRSRRKASRHSEPARATGRVQENDLERKLQQIDAAFDSYMAAGGSAAESIVLGEHQAQQVVKPLSDERLVQDFRQLPGE
jgi:hypothetical protein